MEQLETAFQFLTGLQVLTAIVVAILGGVILWREAPLKRKTLHADAQVDLADADNKKVETDQKRFDLYEQMVNKLIERDQLIVDLRVEVTSLKGIVTILQSQLTGTVDQLDAERTLRLAAERERDVQRIDLTRKLSDLENQLRILQTSKG